MSFDNSPTGYHSQDIATIERLNADVLTIAGQVRRVGMRNLELEALAKQLRTALFALMTDVEINFETNRMSMKEDHLGIAGDHWHDAAKALADSRKLVETE